MGDIMCSAADSSGHSATAEPALGVPGARSVSEHAGRVVTNPVRGI